MSYKLKILVFKDPSEEVLVLDGDDNGREQIEQAGSANFTDWPDDYDMYQRSDAGLFVIEAEYEDESMEQLIDSSIRRLNAKELVRVSQGADVLMDI